MAVGFDNLKSQIGTNVSFHRRLQGLSIKELAQKSGLASDTISSIEDYSRKTVSDVEVKALAAGLKISRERLFDVFPHADDKESIDSKQANYCAGKVMARKLNQGKV
jgi:transcriptional regulator with XRE-family HTH domain